MEIRQLRLTVGWLCHVTELLQRWPVGEAGCWQAVRAERLGSADQAGFSARAEINTQSERIDNQRRFEVCKCVPRHHLVFNSKERPMRIPAARSTARHHGTKYGALLERTCHLKPWIIAGTRFSLRTKR